MTSWGGVTTLQKYNKTKSKQEEKKRKQEEQAKAQAGQAETQAERSKEPGRRKAQAGGSRRSRARRRLHCVNSLRWDSQIGAGHALLKQSFST